MNANAPNGDQTSERGKVSTWHAWEPSLATVCVVLVIVVAAISLAAQDVGLGTRQVPTDAGFAGPTTEVLFSAELLLPADTTTAQPSPSPTPSPVPSDTATPVPSDTATPAPPPTITPLAWPITPEPAAAITAEPAATVPVLAIPSQNVCGYPNEWGDPNTWVQYTVKTNDNLFSIASKAQISLWSLVSTNCFTEGTQLAAGQQIWLPLLGRPSATSPSQSTPVPGPASPSTPFVSAQSEDAIPCVGGLCAMPSIAAELAAAARSAAEPAPSPTPTCQPDDICR